MYMAEVIWPVLVMLAFFPFCLNKPLQKNPVFIITFGILKLEGAHMIEIQT